MIRRIQTQHQSPTPFVSLASTVYRDAGWRWSLGHSRFSTTDGTTIHRVDLGPLVVQWEASHG
jgi:hypothetical protein